MPWNCTAFDSTGRVSLPPETVDPPDYVTVNSDTFHSIGIVWDLESDQDTDHDATVSVRYRIKNSGNYLTGLNLIRNDYAWFYNPSGEYPPPDGVTTNFAGSLMFLTPGEIYEIELTYTDPDGTDTYDGTVVNFEATTRTVPVKPTGGSDIFVDNSVGGPGSGSTGDPYVSIQLANDNASPGDRVKIRTGSGTYTGAILDTPGAEDNHIVYEPDTANSPVLARLGVDASHIWIDALAFEWDGTGTLTSGGDSANTSAIYGVVNSTTDDVLITDCDMSQPNTSLPTPYPANNDLTGQHYANGISNEATCTRWVCMDNDVVGMWVADGGAGGLGGIGSVGNGIRVGGEAKPGGQGCVVAFNTITRSTDGVDIGPTDIVNSCCDVYSNQISDTVGNGISTDAAWSNMRVWGNRASYCGGSPMSMQPQKLGPWYYCYNQYADIFRGVFKYRTGDRLVMVNNTFVGSPRDSGNQPAAGAGQVFMKCMSRNNLWVAAGVAQVWNTTSSSGEPDYDEPQYTADWNTDIDYDGFDRGGANFFYWDGNSTFYNSLSNWTAAVQNVPLGNYPEQNAVEVVAGDIWDNFTYDLSADQTLSFNLASGTNAAVDAGILVDNLADWHGATPDLGAYQRGASALQIGIRTSELSLPLNQRTLYWDKH